jgi:S-formylglutathione hydrolase FrmB
MKLFVQCSICAFLCFISAFSKAAKVDTVAIPSNAMHKIFKAVVVLPDTYSHLSVQFPVVYMLHGGEGSYRDWLSKTTDKLLLHKMADEYGVIIVTPDGGGMSYYFDSPQDKTSEFETYISKEVAQYIDSVYHTIRNRKGRIIAGLSMGGHGAFYLATRHPDVYCAAGAISGAMDLDLNKWNIPPDFAKSRRENFEHLLGHEKSDVSPWPGYSVIDLVAQMKNSNVKYIFDCGFDDILITPNRELHQLLLANGTPHDYTERPGKHNWQYFENSVPYQFVFFEKVFKENGSL